MIITSNEELWISQETFLSLNQIADVDIVPFYFPIRPFKLDSPFNFFPDLKI